LVKVVKYLVDKKAKVNACINDKTNAILGAAIVQNSPEMTRDLRLYF
jgi:hypothetical protein